MFIILFFIFIPLFIYFWTSMVFFTIAKKLGYGKPWIAWIPVVKLFLIPILAKLNWKWGCIIFVAFLNSLIILFYPWDSLPRLVSILLTLLLILIDITIVALFSYWFGFILEQRNYPRHLSFLLLGGMIPLVGVLFILAFLIVLSIVAWSDRPQRQGAMAVGVMSSPPQT